MNFVIILSCYCDLISFFLSLIDAKKLCDIDPKYPKAQDTL